MSVRPDFGTHARASDERIVGGYRPIAIDTQHFAETIVQSLRVGGIRVLAHADVELAIGPEVDRAAIVVAGAAQVIQIGQHKFTAGQSDVAVRGEAADAVVGRVTGNCVIDVDEMIRREVWIESYAEQAALAV